MSEMLASQLHFIKQEPQDETVVSDSDQTLEVGHLVLNSAWRESSSMNLLGHPIPAHSDWPGEYGFTIGPFCRQLLKKSVHWLFEEKLKKLFAKPDVGVPINICLSKEPPEGCIVRAMLVYTNVEHARFIPKRCKHHIETDVYGIAPPDHILRCDNMGAVYEDDALTKRHSVTVPYRKPQVGEKCTVLLYRFMCLSSCVSGLNRRAAKLILTLEHGSEILGRQGLEIRICSCPGRDMLHETRRLIDSEEKRRFPNRQVAEQPRQDICPSPATDPGAEASNKENQKKDVFYLKVRGEKNYNILRSLRDALELWSDVNGTDP